VRTALKILIDCNDRLGLTPLADQARKVYAFNYPDGDQPAPAQRKSWWRRW